jgi:hypothetical protein
VPAVQDKAVLVVSESSHSQPARRNEYARQGSESESDVCVAQSRYYYMYLYPSPEHTCQFILWQSPVV